MIPSGVEAGKPRLGLFIIQPIQLDYWLPSIFLQIGADLPIKWEIIPAIPIAQLWEFARPDQNAVADGHDGDLLVISKRLAHLRDSAEFSKQHRSNQCQPIHGRQIMIAQVPWVSQGKARIAFEQRADELRDFTGTIS